MLKRCPDSDFMRLIASFAVVLNHVAGANTPEDVYSCGFTVVCALNAASHFSVPLFIMISGRFMLGFGENISRAIKHTLKCIVWIVVWKLVYFADKLIFEGADAAFAMNEPQHLWYLYTAAALYLAAPALSVFAVNASIRVYRYCLIAGLVMCSVLRLMAEFINPVDVFVGKTHIDTSFGFIWCYLFGYYIYNREAAKKIIPLGVLGAAVTVFGTITASVIAGQHDYRLLSFLAPNVLMYSAAVVYGIKKIFERNNIFDCKWISCASQTTGIIYGIHMLIFEKLSNSLTTTGCIKRTVILSAAVWLISAMIGAAWCALRYFFIRSVKNLSKLKDVTARNLQR